MSRLCGRRVRVVLVAASLAGLVGCQPGQTAGWGWPRWAPKTKAPPASRRKEVPSPINLLLPETIKIHIFTGVRTFDEAGGIKGIDARITAKNAFGDATKALGKFRFELYRFRPHIPDPKGDQLGLWNVDLSEPKVNVQHWEEHLSGYKFKLKWSRSIPVGKQFVLVVVFTSPFTERLYDQRVFVAGQ